MCCAAGVRIRWAECGVARPDRHDHSHFRCDIFVPEPSCLAALRKRKDDKFRADVTDLSLRTCAGNITLPTNWVTPPVIVNRSLLFVGGASPDSALA